MVTTPEKDFQKDLEALRADIAALTDTVGSLAAQAAKAEAAIAKNVRKAAKGAAGTGERFGTRACSSATMPRRQPWTALRPASPVSNSRSRRTR